MSMQLEKILSEQQKVFLQFRMINYKISSQVNLQPYSVRSSWGTSLTNPCMPTYMDHYQSTFSPQDSWEDSFEPSSSQPASPHNEAPMQTRPRQASLPCSNIPAPPEHCWWHPGHWKSTMSTLATVFPLQLSRQRS